MTSAAAVLCVILWWTMAAGLVGVAVVGHREVVAGRVERGRGLARFGLGMAALVAVVGLPMTIGLSRWLFP